MWQLWSLQRRLAGQDQSQHCMRDNYGGMGGSEGGGSDIYEFLKQFSEIAHKFEFHSWLNVWVWCNGEERYVV
jgi:hypothetical protein